MFEFTRLGVRVPTNSLADNELSTIKTELTVAPMKTEYDYKETSYKVYQQSTNNIYVPRFFFQYVSQNRNEYSSVSHPVTNNVPCGERIELVFDGVLNESTEQPQAARAVVEQLRVNQGCMLCLPTGFGKTTVALHVLAKMGLKTLIVVHKEFLMTQWVEKIALFLPGAKVGRIQGSIVDVNDKDIVVGMLQSLSMKTYDRTTFELFGLTIIDETHHVCAKTFSKLFTKFNTRYVLGLSATIQRTDGLTHVLHWFLGNVGYHTKRVNQSHVHVDLIHYTPTIRFPLMNNGKPNMAAALTLLTEDETRNGLIDEAIRDCFCSTDRRIIVLTDRREHCMQIVARCQTLYGEASSGLFIGGMKADEYRINERRRIIVGTYSLAHEGLDIPALDTIVLATPKSNVVQAVGRILRETKGKQNHPLVIDIVDRWGPIHHQFRKRKQYYTETGFSLKTPQETRNTLQFIKDD
jgi:hypothetical protein